MAEDPGVLDVVAQLDKACTEVGFFYVVILSSINFYFVVLICYHSFLLYIRVDWGKENAVN